MLRFPVNGLKKEDLYDWSLKSENYRITRQKKNNQLVEVNGIDIALFRYGERIFAIKEYCPHQGGPLHLGEIEELPDGEPCIKCPWHCWCIKLKDGKIVSSKNRQPTSVYPVKIDERGNIFIEFQCINEKYFTSEDF
ncbi:3-phenylpropionate/cinnamic acid dioxygenase ferredoxin subunit-like [Centruroides vittatus]|uniref:3-phenylpropionate/cinnamic acid dioxygenase ferredoxin subunit-like n=1 Tax=Centruroides vittatus TaxID=120091 RepID=UPI00350EEE41